MVNYITEGELKASLRKLDPRPWKPDLPWHRSYAEDATPLTPGQVEEIVIDLEPTSNAFLKGHRLRVSIAGWDEENFGGPQFDPPPTISMYRDSARASYIELPIIGEVAQIAPAPSAPPGVVALPPPAAALRTAVSSGRRWPGCWSAAPGQRRLVCFASGSPGSPGAAAADRLATRDKERRRARGLAASL